MLRVHLTPHASRDEIIGVVVLADGMAVMKIKVRAVPEKGKANKALLAFLAKKLGLAKSSLRVVSGMQSRHKRIEIVGDVGLVVSKLESFSCA